MQSLDRISGYAHVALRYGMEEAIFLDSIVFWYKENKANDRNFQDGRWWTFNTVSAFEALFPWWSAKQIRRIIASCRDQGALLAGNYNEDQRDRTVWYSPGDELLALYGFCDGSIKEPRRIESCAGTRCAGRTIPGLAEEGNCICPNGQMQEAERANETAQTGKCNIEHVKTHGYTPYSPPEGTIGFGGSMTRDGTQSGDSGTVIRPSGANDRSRHSADAERLFDAFWSAYPKKRGKEKARRAWKKLKPDIALCRTMAAALERDKASRDWRKDAGAYIPYPATWLNGRRWEDEPSQPPPEPAAAPLRGEGVSYL